MKNDKLSKQKTRVGFIGLGLMGSRFLRRLNSQGWNLRGWTRSHDTTSSLENDGFRIDSSIADLVLGSDVVLSSLSDDNAVHAVYMRMGGVFANVLPGTIVLEMSTISPHMSALLHEEAKKRGVSLLDLPVSGSTLAVESGTVTLFAGGDSRTFDICVPIFESIAKRWYLMGPATAGIRMKLVVNLLLGINMEAIAEAVSFGEHLELNRDILLDVLPETTVIAPAFAGKFSKILTEDYSPQFPLHLMNKDLQLVRSAAAGSIASLPVASATINSYKEAVEEQGKLDISAITSYIGALAARS